MKTGLQTGLFFFLWLASCPCLAQVTPPADSLPPPTKLDTLLVAPAVSSTDTLLLGDSIVVQSDSILPLNFRAGSARPDVPLSKDSLDAPVEYTARDSMRYDIANEKIYLFGNASVQYQTMTLTADYIIFDWANNIVIAEGVPDSLGKLSGLPNFKDGDQQFSSKKMRYNFKTSKGIIYDASTKQGSDMYVLSNKAKFISHQADSTHQQVDDVVYSTNSIFTTCDHPDPHFGIRSKKQKVVPGKVVVVGPSNLEIAGVPTPLWLPFGFFPLKQGKRTGLIFPRDYEFSPTWGFGLRNVGWFFPLGEYFNLQATGDIYTRGTWGLQARANYKRRYKYAGDFNLSFSNRRSEFANGLPKVDRSYKLRWSHRQDPNAHPTNQFNVSANIQTNDYQSLNDNEAGKVLENSLSSNIAFSRRFPGKPFTLNVSAAHSQNTNTREVRISAPVVNFQMNRIFPFKREVQTGGERWYEKVSLRYQLNAQQQFVATDTTLFSHETWDNAQNGIRHTLNTDASFRVLKHFNLTPNLTYKELWYFKTLKKEFDPTVTVDTIYNVNPNDTTERFIERLDTTQYGSVEDMFVNGFNRLPLLERVGVSLSTQVFGLREFNKGLIRGIRHTLKPSFTFGYTPDYTRESLMYFDSVQTDIRFPDELSGYSIFDKAIYDRPPNGGKNMGITYSFNNIFEGKYFSKKDSSVNNLKLFDNIVVGGNYNFVADSLHWSQVNIRGTTRFFKGITTLNITAVYDPYDVEYTESGAKRRINRFYLDSRKRLLRFDRATLRLNTGISVAQLRQLFDKGSTGSATGSGTAQGVRPTTAGSIASGQDLLSLFENFRITHTFSLQRNSLQHRDTVFVEAHTLRFTGSIKLTDKWSIRFGNISYNFKSKSFIYPDLSFTRDLHCWEMGMSWQPERGTYSFFLRVRPGPLDFINIPYKKNNADAFRGF